MLCLLVKGKGALLQLSCFLQQLPLPFGHVGRPHSWRSSSSLRPTAVTAPANIILFIPPAPPQLQAQAQLSHSPYQLLAHSTTLQSVSHSVSQRHLIAHMSSSRCMCLSARTALLLVQSFSFIVKQGLSVCSSSLSPGAALNAQTKGFNQAFSRGDVAPDAHQHHLTPQSCHHCPPLLADLPALGGSGGWGHLTPGLSLGCCCALSVMGTSHEPSDYAGPSG